MIVVKLGGNASRAQLGQLVEAGPLVLVHGGGAQVTAMLARLGVETRFVEGLRYTDEATMEVVEMVLGGRLNKQLACLLQSLGARAVGICGSDAGTLRTRRHPQLRLAGQVESVDPGLLQTLLGAGYLPVVAPLGLGPDGERHNVNADQAAVALARALGAERLVMLTDVPGVRCQDRWLEQLDAAQAEALMADGQATGGMLAKLRAALEAVRAGVSVQIGSSLEKGTRLAA